jgi:hypothetical protein
MLQAERDDYLRAVYAWAEEQITEEDLQQFEQDIRNMQQSASEEQEMSLTEFIEELERQHAQSRGR